MKYYFLLLLKGIFKESFLIIFLLFFFSGVFDVCGEDKKKTILWLNSYHDGYLWSDNLKQGLMDNLSFDDPEYNLYIENMDTKNHEPDNVFPVLAELYEKKYSSNIPDVIIASDNNAVKFLSLYSDKVFPGTSVVFCGVNNFNDDILKGFSKVTGVVEEASFVQTIQLALDIFPGTKSIYSIAGSAETTKVHIEELNKAADSFNHIEFTGLSELTFKEFRMKLEKIPEDAVIIYLGLYRDILGKTLGVGESFEFIRKYTNRPIFTMWDQNIPFCFGGVMISGREQGRSASLMAIRILQGEEAGSIPIIRDSPNCPMFNYNELLRFSINEETLPADSVFINTPPPSFYFQYKKEIWLGVIMIIILILLIISLLFTLSYRNIALKKQSRLWNYINNILDSDSSTIIGVDLSLKVTQWNNSAVKCIGIDKKTAIGKDLSEVYPPSLQNFENVRNAVLNRKHLVELNLKEKRDGKDIYEDVTVSPLISENEEGAVIRIDNVSERVHLDELRMQSENLRDQLIQSQKMESIGRLAGGVAHDLNNLLVPIIGYSEILNKEESLSTDHHDALDEIFNAGIRAQDLIRQLLAFSRKQVLEVKILDLNGIIRDFNKLLRRTIKENVGINLNLLDIPLYIMADKGQVEQVLMNLLVNAADAMPEGGEIKITTDLNREGEKVLLEIADNGLGMDEEICSKIFEPFFSTKGEYGTGLGLSTVHGIIKQHGGDIKVKSRIGEGTVFNINLSYVNKTEKVGESVFKIEKEAVRKGSESILVVEDNPQVLALSKRILEKNGYIVLCASSGSSALPLIENNDLDLLLTDIVMPEINGKELYSLALLKKPELKVLYMSGYNDKIITHVDGQEFDIPFVKKPFTEIILISKIREALDE